MMFEIVSGFPLPRLAYSAEGVERSADGKRFFTAEQIAYKFGCPIEAMEAVYLQFFADLGPADTAGQHRQTRQLSSEDEQRVLRNVRYGWLSDEHYELFVSECRRRGLSPWGGSLPILKWNADAKRRELQIIVSIYQLRALCYATGQFAGETDTLWAGPDGKWKDSWTSEDYPAWAKVGVRREGTREIFWGKARWDSYCQYIVKASGKIVVGDFWHKMGPELLAIRAETIALRKAFADFCGLVEAPSARRKAHRQKSESAKENGQHRLLPGTTGV
jgi:hypothetical protein